MKPEYNVICIPLDGHSPAAGPTAFTVAIACELRFPQGSFPPADVARILARHLRGDIEAYTPFLYS